MVQKMSVSHQHTERIQMVHAEPVEDVFAYLETSSNGLATEEARRRLEVYGANVLDTKEGPPWWHIFLRQFQDFLIYVLLVAAGISFAFQHPTDGVVILVVVFVNAILGFIQEYKAEQAIARLQKNVEETVTVYRSGYAEKIPIKDLVPGDVIDIKEGDKVPADVRLFETKSLRINEASLTGESVPVDKQVEPVSENTPLGDRTGMAFMGTFCTSGHGKGVVVRTGMDTVLGSIVTDIAQIEVTETHFHRQTQHLAQTLAVIAFILATLLGVATFVWGKGLIDSFYVAIVSLVGSIPEGLPAVLVVVLALGARRMAARNAVIRSLSATNTLGSTSTIVTDKTGTLTQNTMTVKHVLLPDQNPVDVTGDGWSPDGAFFVDGDEIVPYEYHHLGTILHMSVMATDARVYWDEEAKTYTITGDPTEAALVSLAEKAGLSQDIAQNSEDRLDDLTFSSERKFRASLVRHKETGRRQIYVIGAAEVVLAHSSHVLAGEHPQALSETEQEALLDRITPYTNQAMRMLAIALKDVPEDQHGVEEGDVEGLTFVGIVGMMDPPRPEVRTSLQKAREAGVRVIMATGDHAQTAESIARQVGLLTEEDGKEAVLTQNDLERLSDRQLQDTLETVRVCARLSPHMKLRIAKALQAKGEVVAMTGDGVNDAPALKQADVGIAMGITGTDVAREASQIVLTDDNFGSIVTAIEEGRVVFRNVRQTGAYLVSGNIAEDIVLLIAVGSGFGLPLLPAQLLWLNLATSGITDIALATEGSHGEVLRRSPDEFTKGILTPRVWSYIGTVAVAMGIPAVTAFLLLEDTDTARTVTFLILAAAQIFNIFNFRSLTYSIGQIGGFSNGYVMLGAFISALVTVAVLVIPVFREVFSFVLLPLNLWLGSIAAALPVLLIGELYKWRLRQMNEI